jgi:hypothetical protein
VESFSGLRTLHFSASGLAVSQNRFPQATRNLTWNPVLAFAALRNVVTYKVTYSRDPTNTWDTMDRVKRRQYATEMEGLFKTYELPIVKQIKVKPKAPLPKRTKTNANMESSMELDFSNIPRLVDGTAGS